MISNEFFYQIPVQNIEWEIDPETNLVVLKKLKFKNRLLKKYLLPRLGNRYFRIKLDKIGTFVWHRIDGKNTINDIANALEIQMGDEVRPIHERLAKFISSLSRSQFIKMLVNH
jgi:hypothetical protein